MKKERYFLPYRHHRQQLTLVSLYISNVRILYCPWCLLQPHLRKHKHLRVTSCSAASFANTSRASCGVVSHHPDKARWVPICLLRLLQLERAPEENTKEQVTSLPRVATSKRHVASWQSSITSNQPLTPGGRTIRQPWMSEISEQALLKTGSSFSTNGRQQASTFSKEWFNAGADGVTTTCFIVIIVNECTRFYYLKIHNICLMNGDKHCK